MPSAPGQLELKVGGIAGTQSSIWGALILESSG